MAWADFVERGRISMRLLLPFTIVTGCFLFMPDAWKLKLNIKTISAEYAQWFGVIFIITAALIIIDIIVMLFNGVGSKLKQSKISGYVKEHIQELSYYEKTILREFFITGSNTLSLPINNPNVLGLISKRILFQVGSTGAIVHYEPCFSYSITEIAKKHLTHSSIDLPQEQTSENLQWISNNRFSW